MAGRLTVLADQKLSFFYIYLIVKQNPFFLYLLNVNLILTKPFGSFDHNDCLTFFGLSAGICCVHFSLATGK